MNDTTTKPTARRIGRFKRSAFVAAFLELLSLGLTAQGVKAGSATWNFHPTNSDWNTAANWTPATVPNDPADVATFESSDTTNVSISGITTVDGIVFNPDASAFTIATAPSGNLTLSGAGIANNSGIAQNFVVGVGDGLIEFLNRATAGSGTTFSNSGFIDFFDSSNASCLTISQLVASDQRSRIRCFSDETKSSKFV